MRLATQPTVVWQGAVAACAAAVFWVIPRRAGPARPPIAEM